VRIAKYQGVKFECLGERSAMERDPNQVVVQFVQKLLGVSVEMKNLKIRGSH